MRTEVMDYLKRVLAAYDCIAPVYDMGGVFALEQEAEFGPQIRTLFAGCDYQTFDPRSGADIQGDIHKTGLPEGAVGTILCLETLEHIPHPAVALFEMYRILKPGGLIILTTAQCWEEHGCPMDYWRFLPDGIRLLLEHPGFKVLDITTEGAATSPSGIFATGVKD